MSVSIEIWAHVLLQSDYPLKRRECRGEKRDEESLWRERSLWGRDKMERGMKGRPWGGIRRLMGGEQFSRGSCAQKPAKEWVVHEYAEVLVSGIRSFLGTIERERGRMGRPQLVCWQRWQRGERRVCVCVCVCVGSTKILSRTWRAVLKEERPYFPLRSERGKVHKSMQKFLGSRRVRWQGNL